MKFNEITVAADADKHITDAMAEYQSAKRRNDKWMMALAERVIIACGGSINQAAYPSPFLLMILGPKRQKTWQAKRNKAQVEVDKLLAAFSA